MSLLLELRHPGESEWTVVGRVKLGEPGGSLSNRSERGRDILQFECREDEAIIERSLAGVDEDLSATVRRVTTVGVERLATLTDGESYEIELCTDRMTAAVPFRFRHVNDAGEGKARGALVTVTVHGPRAATFERVFGTATVPIKSPAPHAASLPGFDELQLVFEIDLDWVRREGHREKLVAYLAERFEHDLAEVDRCLEAEGMPILAEDCILQIADPSLVH